MSTQPDLKSGENVAKKVLEFQEKKREAEEKMKKLQEEIECVDKDLDQFLQDVVACL
jgi:peptidoglycan hydrolase CwlO-like protein